MVAGIKMEEGGVVEWLDIRVTIQFATCRGLRSENPWADSRDGGGQPRGLRWRQRTSHCVEWEIRPQHPHSSVDGQHRGEDEEVTGLSEASFELASLD